MKPRPETESVPLERRDEHPLATRAGQRPTLTDRMVRKMIERIRRDRFVQVTGLISRKSASPRGGPR